MSCLVCRWVVVWYLSFDTRQPLIYRLGIPLCTSRNTSIRFPGTPICLVVTFFFTIEGEKRADEGREIDEEGEQ